MYLLPGTELNNRYKIEDVLGHGGFGITYAALDKVLNVKVAIKEYLPRQLATRAEGQTKVTVFTGEPRKHYDYGLRKFLEEAQSVARFAHHPNVVSARDYFEANGTAYMVMEYVEGVTLKEYLEKKGGRLSFEEAKGIMMPVMDALREVHQAGMLHRDVSPDNIYITTSAQVKILDFGAARYFAGEQSKSLSVILKSGYAPEEQYRSSGKQGAWTDVYAVGATIYKALTGQPPPDALDRMAEDTLVPPSRLGVSIPPPAERALLQALAVNAGQRFQNMEAFQQALLDGAPITMQFQQGPVSFQPSHSPVSAQPAAWPLHPPHLPRRSANPAAIAAGAILAIILVVGLIWWQVGHDFSQRSGGGAQQGEVQKPDTPKSIPAVAQTPVTPPPGPVVPKVSPEFPRKWRVEWKGGRTKALYTGLLSINNKINDKTYTGSMSVKTPQGYEVLQDVIVYIDELKVNIKCSNSSKTNYPSDNFFLNLLGNTMKGYDKDVKGNIGLGVTFTAIN